MEDDTFRKLFPSGNVAFYDENEEPAVDSEGNEIELNADTIDAIMRKSVYDITMIDDSNPDRYPSINTLVSEYISRDEFYSKLADELINNTSFVDEEMSRNVAQGYITDAIEEVKRQLNDEIERQAEEEIRWYEEDRCRQSAIDREEERLEKRMSRNRW